jgi:hypothetical protein
MHQPVCFQVQDRNLSDFTLIFKHFVHPSLGSRNKPAAYADRASNMGLSLRPEDAQAEQEAPEAA